MRPTVRLLDADQVFRDPIPTTNNCTLSSDKLGKSIIELSMSDSLSDLFIVGLQDRSIRTETLHNLGYTNEVPISAAALLFTTCIGLIRRKRFGKI